MLAPVPQGAGAGLGSVCRTFRRGIPVRVGEKGPGAARGALRPPRGWPRRRPRARKEGGLCGSICDSRRSYGVRQAVAKSSSPCPVRGVLVFQPRPALISSCGQSLSRSRPGEARAGCRRGLGSRAQRLGRAACGPRTARAQRCPHRPGSHPQPATVTSFLFPQIHRECFHFGSLFYTLVCFSSSEYPLVLDVLLHIVTSDPAFTRSSNATCFLARPIWCFLSLSSACGVSLLALGLAVSRESPR